jgi:threonine dehydratase
MADALVTPDDVVTAYARIRDRIRRTPVIDVGAAELGLPVPVTLKLELLQHAGSFKPRGAFNRVLAAPDVPAAGLIAASGGNHGSAVAYVAGALGLSAEVFVPSTSPMIKRRNVERFGAILRVVDGLYDDAQREADLRQMTTGALLVHPFDHAATVAGQATMALELEQQLPDGFDTLVVATGGGGFIAGQAAWLRDRVRIVSVEPETSQCLRAALAKGAPVDVDVSGVATDSLGARRLGAVPWSLVRDYVDVAVVVPDDEIRAAQHALWSALRLVVEPGGAAALAALRCGAYVPAPGERVVVVLCGANCDPATVTESSATHP